MTVNLQREKKDQKSHRNVDPNILAYCISSSNSPSYYVWKINFFLFRPLLIGFTATLLNVFLGDLLLIFLSIKYELLELN